MPHHNGGIACVSAVSGRFRNGWIRPCPRPSIRTDPQPVYDMPGAPAGGGGCGNSIEDDDSNEHVHTAVHGFPFGLDYPIESNSATVLGVWHQFSIESGTPRPPGAKTARLGSLMDLPAKTGPSGSPMRIGRGSKFRWPCKWRRAQFLIRPQFW